MRRLACAVGRRAAPPAPRPPSAETVLKVSLHSDLKIVDPIWTTALISAHHGNMVYDTLFSVDDELKPSSRRWSTSGRSRADKLTWTFTLRDGLEWHDGKPVTARIASPRSSAGRPRIRWARS